MDLDAVVASTSITVPNANSFTEDETLYVLPTATPFTDNCTEHVPDAVCNDSPLICIFCLNILLTVYVWLAVVATVW